MQTIEHIQQQIKDEIEQFVRGDQLQRAPEELYTPIQYFLSQDGKRMRPLLVLLACELFGGDLKQAVDPAIGIELFHNFTLMHDDIMDKAPLRRNQPTVHQKWNTNVAILSGDVMLVKAYQLIAKCDKAALPLILNIFSRTAIQVCEGQQYDMDFESSDEVAIADYVKMIELKTAVLLAASLQMGALLGGAGKEDAQHLYEFGRNIGIAFQLQDDLLDVFGDAATFGKQVGGDILSGKKTFLWLKALDLAQGEVKEQLSAAFHSDQLPDMDKVNAVKEIYLQLDIREKTREQIQKYYQNALTHMDAIAADEKKKQPLLQLAENLMQREK